MRARVTVSPSTRAVSRVEVGDLDEARHLELRAASRPRRRAARCRFRRCGPRTSARGGSREVAPRERPFDRAQNRDRTAAVDGGQALGTEVVHRDREAGADRRLAQRHVGLQRLHPLGGRRGDREREHVAVLDLRRVRGFCLGDAPRDVAGRGQRVRRHDDVDDVGADAMQGELDLHGSMPISRWARR